MRFTKFSFCLFVFLIALLDISVFAQTSSSIPSPEWIEEHKDSLRKELLINKKVPEKFEHSILAALMHYPGLKSTRIKFKRTPISTTMAARPTIWSIFRLRSKRKYVIAINDEKNRRLAPLLKNTPFKARVGVIGHELGHIVDYNNKSSITIVGNGAAYLFSKRFKRNLEYKIDSITITRNLGEGLLAFRKFIEEEAKTTRQYRAFKKDIYMSSSEIAQMVIEVNQGLSNDRLDKED
ncbi:MAG: hypothetical protein ACLFNU_05190 [Bacteroidales bacterium]